MTTKQKGKIGLILFAALVVLAGMVIIIYYYVNHWGVEITLRGDSTVVLEYGEAYTEPGGDAMLFRGKNAEPVRELEVEVRGTVDEFTLGTYVLDYRATSSWARGFAQRTVIVRDTCPPVITLDGESRVAAGEDYVEEGFTAWDAHDGDLTAYVKHTAEGNTIRYEVTDSSGNTGEAVRNLRYEDAYPVLTLLGESTLVLPASPYPFEDPGCTAASDSEGDLTDRIVRRGAVNPYRAGEYILTYTVTDSEGREGKCARVVIVTAAEPPEPVRPEGKVIYLTFDDGPSENTERLLDILDAYGIKATWFVTECRYDYVNLLADIAARGHSLGVHTATHNYDEIYSSEDAFFSDFRDVWEEIRNRTGIETRLMRFPGGSSNTVSRFNPGIMSTLTQEVQDMGFRYFDWNVSSADTAWNASRSTVIENIKEGVEQHDISVVLQHDIYDFSVEAVEEILRWGLEKGYTFLPLTPGCFEAHHDVAN